MMKSTVLLCLLLFAAVARGEESEMEKPFKNVHFLLKLTRPQLNRTMSFIRASLGVHCDFCHVVGKNGWVWDSDEKPTKNKARQMIQMVMELNNANFKGEPKVSCFTCHQGQIRPNSQPHLPQIAPSYPTPIPATGIVDTAPSKILDRYIEATGGSMRASILKASTLIMKGTTDETWKQVVVPYEVYFKAPDKWLIKIVDKERQDKDRTVIYVMNGTTGWTRDSSGATEMKRNELISLRETLNSLRLLPVSDPPQTSVVRKEEINEQEIDSIEYAVENGVTEKLDFDSKTGLLIRKSRFTPSPAGIIPEEIRYENYKELNGAKIPYTLRASYVDPWISGNRIFSEIQIDLPLDDSMFEMPADKP